MNLEHYTYRCAISFKINKFLLTNYELFRQRYPLERRYPCAGREVSSRQVGAVHSALPGAPRGARGARCLPFPDRGASRDPPRRYPSLHPFLSWPLPFFLPTGRVPHTAYAYLPRIAAFSR